MEKIKNILNQYKIYIALIILFILILIFILLNDSNNKKDVKIEKEVKTSSTQTEKVKKKYLRVDIKGEVVKPGVYELEENKRVIDLINMAGGLSKNADTSYINLSKKLKDEMTIVVYSKEEIAKMKDKESIIVYMEKECECDGITNDACIYNESKNNNSNKNSSEKNSTKKESGSKVNINTANIEELTELKGIGESKAEAIIKYREENGKFKSIEDIMNVTGIGESAYSKIKENITV